MKQKIIAAIEATEFNISNGNYCPGGTGYNLEQAADAILKLFEQHCEEREGAAFESSREKAWIKERKSYDYIYETFTDYKATKL